MALQLEHLAGVSLSRLNMAAGPIEHKYSDGTVKSPLARESKALEASVGHEGMLSQCDRATPPPGWCVCAA